MDEQLFQLMVSRFDKLENKVDDLLKFKWQIYGVTVFISAFLALVVQVVISYVQGG